MSDLKRVCRHAWQRISRTYRTTTFEHLPPVLVFMLLMIMVARWCGGTLCRSGGVFVLRTSIVVDLMIVVTACERKDC